MLYILTVYLCLTKNFVTLPVNYNMALGLFVVLASEIATFTWNFQDVFLIQLSIGLVTRFKHINSIVSKMDIKVTLLMYLHLTSFLPLLQMFSTGVSP